MEQNYLDSYKIGKCLIGSISSSIIACGLTPGHVFQSVGGIDPVCAKHSFVTGSYLGYYNDRNYGFINTSNGCTHKPVKLYRVCFGVCSLPHPVLRLAGPKPAVCEPEDIYGVCPPCDDQSVVDAASCLEPDDGECTPVAFNDGKVVWPERENVSVSEDAYAQCLYHVVDKIECDFENNFCECKQDCYNKKMKVNIKVQNFEIKCEGPFTKLVGDIAVL